MIIKKSRDIFATVTTEGSALPPDILQRVADLDQALPGLTPEAYHLTGGEKLSEATNRAWNRLLAAWGSFKTVREAIPGDKPGTSETREKWLLPLFNELGYGRLLGAKAIELGGKSYSISHGWGSTPIHLLGCNVPLDKKTRGIQGATIAAPHGLVQELLNRSDDHLWAFVTNGLKLRILRDNISFTRQAFVEFDLEAMMEGQVYPDFRLLWLVCHQSRVEAARPEDCFLEQWSKAARDIGSRVLEHLRTGVESAINELGTGFLKHPSNLDIRTKLASGALDKQDYFRQLLRLIYRLLFLFVSEDRGLLLKDSSSRQAEVFLRFYSTARLRTLAASLRGTRHDDLFEGLRLIMQRLGTDEGCPELGLAPLGSMLFSKSAMPDIEPCRISNESLLAAVRHLATITGPEGLRPVDFKNLGAEELGSIYESLLELHPNMDDGFKLETAAGHERKTTGSYYTPESLIQSLLDTALDPVLAEARKAENPEQAILDLKVCDPACGSGHFLLAAANRMAKALAAARTGEDEPAPEAVRDAKRAIISRCIYGVDLNPMAVELCKVSLWLESMDPGKPLSFLDSHVQCGNSLLGATPALLRAGIPDEAFSPIEGDEKERCQAAKKSNKEQRKDHAARLKRSGLMPYAEEPFIQLGNLAESVQAFMRVDDSTIEGVRERQRMWESLASGSGYRFGRMWADAWCAAFVWKKIKAPAGEAFYPITEDVFRRIEKNPFSIPDWMQKEIERLSRQYQFFHWHLAFPEVFRLPCKGNAPENAPAGWDGGFDVVLGNPPWERIKIQEKEWFAGKRPDIANARNAAERQRLIRELAQTDPDLLKAFNEDKRKAEGESHLLRNSSRYPLCGRGDINTYTIFTELGRSVLSPIGRLGCIVPSGIASDDTTKFFFQDIVERQSLVSLYDFENKNLFPAVDSRMKFCLLTLTGAKRPAKGGAEFAFFLHDVAEIREEERRFKLTAEDIALINPNTRTCPIFRSKRDAEITKGIYRRVPVLIREATEKEPEVNPWGLRFMVMFHMANDSALFKFKSDLEQAGWTLRGNHFVKDEETHLPLYEAKMIHHYDHRWATYEPDGSTRNVTLEEKQDSDFVVMPRYWVHEWEVAKRASRCPDAVIKALAAAERDPGEAERKLVTSALVMWLAGYHLNHGDKELGNKLLAATQPRTASLIASTTGGVAVQAMEEEYPLTPDEAEQVKQALTGDTIQQGRDLVLSRTPKWFMGWRDITNTTNERTVIPGITPAAAFGDTFLLMFPAVNTREQSPILASSLTSFALDYAARQKVGGTHLKYHVFKQIPVLPPNQFDVPAPWTLREPLQDWIQARARALYASDYQMSELLNITYQPRSLEERFAIRCELDAAFFHLYGISREDVDYIMDTFPIVRRKDEAAHGCYRTKEMILEKYDEMAGAMRDSA
ncbi:Methyltransferase domain-containing protein [Humidesulfovibrio mexicanus]|uniref:site-specific DNA-methyltransferase (adenine-specific) n=1 Tax=Humidesulfovibrio mexicanus TaxID=147047 RepID=A0A238XZZ7_9BACT|nr:N-6 DNA methylase [Humidesulfovibrio mexicanus]SNR64091.1 Methyltransferase domain-containing protein [Humidesulfovibrio mexicanus]